MKWLLLFLLSSQAWSNPYPDPKRVIAPKLPTRKSSFIQPLHKKEGSSVLRVEVSWSNNETFKVTGLIRENSGTTALLRRGKKRDSLGSYKAQLILPGGQTLHASAGTGREFRQLALTMSFRFPLTENVTEAKFILEAEHPQSGVMEKVLTQNLSLGNIPTVATQKTKATLLRKALKEPTLKVNFYAEGFGESGESRFMEAALKAIATLEKDLPGSEHFEFRAVFAVSKLKLGRHQDLGANPIIRDSFLGLYFPHWRKFGRWYNVVYPTSQSKYRDAIAQLDYDYPIALIDDGGYWGVGNYKELTAIPISHYQFTYLLLHEFGHFMGLNEEYEGGGPTELEFAPGIKEPWSQNITFAPEADKLKWFKAIAPGIGLPSTQDDYHRHGGRDKNPVGAYRGGYGDSEPQNKSHKPVLQCMMGIGGEFCPVCEDALKELIEFDLGN